MKRKRGQERHNEEERDLKHCYPIGHGIDSLPLELLAYVFDFLSPVGRKMCTLVCRSFAEVLPTSAQKLNGADLCAAVATDGNLELLKRLRERGCPWDYDTLINAARENHLVLAEWALGAKCPICKYHIRRICEQAALHAHLEMLALLRAQGLCHYDAALHAAAASNRREVFLWCEAVEPGKVAHELSGETFMRPLCESAAYGGHIDMLQLLREKGCPWGKMVVVSAVEGGHLQAVQWLLRNGCPWKDRVLVRASKFGHLPIIEWALLNVRPMSSLSDKICHKMILKAARKGHVALVERLLDNGLPRAAVWNDVSDSAARRGHTHVLALLHRHNFTLSSESDRRAANGGHLETLQWLDANALVHLGDRKIIKKSLHEGHLHVTRWAVSRGYKCDIKGLLFMARRGLFELLSLATDNGSLKHYHRGVCRAAVKAGRIDVVEWLGSVGWGAGDLLPASVPWPASERWDDKPFRTVTKEKKREMALALIDGGFAWSLDDAVAWLPEGEAIELRATVKKVVTARLRSPPNEAK